MISVLCIRANVLAAASYVTVRVENVTPPTVNVCRVGLNAMNSEPEQVFVEAVFMVPAGSYFTLVTTTAGAGSTAAPAWWAELSL